MAKTDWELELEIKYPNLDSDLRTWAGLGISGTVCARHLNIKPKIFYAMVKRRGMSWIELTVKQKPKDSDEPAYTKEVWQDESLSDKLERIRKNKEA